MSARGGAHWHAGDAAAAAWEGRSYRAIRTPPTRLRSAGALTHARRLQPPDPPHEPWEDFATIQSVAQQLEEVKDDAKDGPALVRVRVARHLRGGWDGSVAATAYKRQQQRARARARQPERTTSACRLLRTPRQPHESWPALPAHREEDAVETIASESEPDIDERLRARMLAAAEGGAHGRAARASAGRAVALGGSSGSGAAGGARAKESGPPGPTFA